MMTKTSIQLCMATAVASLLCSSGCSLLVRAAKGELTPVGVTQASSGDVSRLARSVSSETDPQAFSKAFADLSSIYLYKCIDGPSMTPKEGKATIREAAGDQLIAAMHSRVAAFGTTDDPVLAAAAGDVAALEGRMTQCDGDKRSKLDPSGQFEQAVALAQVEGREQYMQETAEALDTELEASLSDDTAVFGWASRTCGASLPVWGYCVPRAVEAYYSREQLDSIANVFLSRSEEQIADLLPALGAKVGNDKLVDEVRAFVIGGRASEVSTKGLDVMAQYLRDNDAWGSCDDRRGMLRSALKSERSQNATWAIGLIVADDCRNLDNELVKSMGSDSPWVREKAAWASGELKIQKAKKHLERLRYSDPYTDEGCWCHPVRDAASNAYNKLELHEG